MDVPLRWICESNLTVMVQGFKRMLIDATVSILENQESHEFSSYEACASYSEQVKDGVLKAYDEYKRKQRMHYFWEAGH